MSESITLSLACIYICCLLSQKANIADFTTTKQNNFTLRLRCCSQQQLQVCSNSRKCSWYGFCLCLHTTETLPVACKFQTITLSICTSNRITFVVVFVVVVNTFISTSESKILLGSADITLTPDVISRPTWVTPLFGERSNDVTITCGDWRNVQPGWRWPYHLKYIALNWEQKLHLVQFVRVTSHRVCKINHTIIVTIREKGIFCVTLRNYLLYSSVSHSNILFFCSGRRRYWNSSQVHA